MTPTEKRVARGKEKKFKRKQRDRLEGAVDKFDRFKNGRKGAKGEKGAKEEALRGLVKEGKGVSTTFFSLSLSLSLSLLLILGRRVRVFADSFFFFSFLFSRGKQVTIIGKDAKKFDKKGKRDVVPITQSGTKFKL